MELVNYAPHHKKFGEGAMYTVNVQRARAMIM
jgi:hypothetical protein